MAVDNTMGLKGRLLAFLVIIGLASVSFAAALGIGSILVDVDARSSVASTPISVPLMQSSGMALVFK